jgi:choice-of-anchor B domain-containing protein
MKIKHSLPLVLLCSLYIISCGDDDDPGVIVMEEELLGRIPCENGFADIYPCDNYDLIARLSVEDLNASANNDIWGWTDPINGNEYALVGTRQGTVFVDITQADEPVIIGALLTATDDSVWRDIKVFNNHAFIVSEADNHGMQIFDLTRLRDVTTAPEVFDADAIYAEFGNAHNIVINEDSGYAYAVGTSTFLGGPHFVNIQNPLNPVFEGGFDSTGYTHDAQVVIYNGPDVDYQGQEIFIGSNEDEVVVVDVTDKANPFLISRTVYPDIGYTHQGWLSGDQTYFYANDELDENQFGFESRTLVFDFTDLDNPVFVSPFFLVPT